MVIDRRITQGTRSEADRNWSERIWTTIATCNQYRRNILEFLIESIQALFENGTAPSLLADTT